MQKYWRDVPKIEKKNLTIQTFRMSLLYEEMAIIAIISETFYTRKDWLALSHKWGKDLGR